MYVYISKSETLMLVEWCQHVSVIICIDYRHGGARMALQRLQGSCIVLYENKMPNVLMITKLWQQSEHSKEEYVLHRDVIQGAEEDNVLDLEHWCEWLESCAF